MEEALHLPENAKIVGVSQHNEYWRVDSFVVTVESPEFRELLELEIPPMINPAFVQDNEHSIPAVLFGGWGLPKSE